MDYSKAAKSGKPTNKNDPKLQRGPPLPRSSQKQKGYGETHSSTLANSSHPIPGRMDYSKVAKSGKPHTPVRSPAPSPSRPQKIQKSSEYQTPTAMRRGGGQAGFSGSTTNQTADKVSHYQMYQRPLRPPPTFGDDRNRQNLRKLEEESLTDEAKRKIVENKLKQSQSPFVWKLSQEKPYDNPKTNFVRLEDKAKEIQEKGPFKWRGFILDLVMSYELFRMGEVNQSIDKIKKLESLLRDLEELTETRKNWMFGVIKESLWQVVYSSLVFLHLETNELDKAYQLASFIKPILDLRSRVEAGVHGIKAAAAMEFGHKGNCIAVREALEAVALDRTMGEWHFIFAKSLARIRRVAKCHDEVDPNETKAITRALYHDKQNPYYTIHNAQLLRERAFRVYSKNPFEYKILETKKEKAKQREDKKAYSKSEEVKKIRNLFYAARFRYHEALQLQPENPRMLVRVAFGLMKMPRFFHDLKLISECVEKAVQLAPNNPMVQHVKGIYYERFDTDADQVIEALTKASALNFGAAMDLIRVNYRLKHTNIVEQLEDLAQRFSEPHKLQVVYAQAGSYELFINKDIVGAVKFYDRVLDIDDNSYALKSHKPLFFWVKKPLNMFLVLIEEIGKRAQLSSFPSEEKKILVNFRVRIMKHDEEERKEGEARLGVEEILEMIIQGHKYLNWYKERELIRAQLGKRAPKKWVFGGGKKKKQKTSGKDKENEKDNEGTGGPKISHSKDGWFEKNKQRQCPGSPLDRSRKSSICSVDSDYTRDKTKYGERFTWGESGCLASPALAPDAKSLFANSRRDSSASSCSNWRSRDSSVSSTYSEAAGPKGTHQSRYSGESGLTRDNLQKHDSGLQRRMSQMSIDEPLPQAPHREMSRLSLDDCSLDDEFKKLSIWERAKQCYANMDHIKNDPLHKSESTQTLNKGKGKARKKPIPKSDSTQSLNVPQTKTPLNLFPDGYKSAFGSRDSVAGSSQSFSFMPKFN